MTEKFNYFYGIETEQFNFLATPKILFSDVKFKILSVSAKVLYSFMLERTKFSSQNGWRDVENRVYIVYTNDEIMEQLCCSKDTAIKLTKELEEIGLIEKIRVGLGKPNRIYVKNFMICFDKEDVENSKENVEKWSDFSSRDNIQVEKTDPRSRNFLPEKSENATLEVENSDRINNNYINKNFINNNSIYQSFNQGEVKEQKNSENFFEKNEGLNLKEVVKILNEKNNLSDIETEDDLKIYNEKFRETKNCVIPYTLKKDRQAMHSALKFLSCYSYYFQDDNKDIDIGLADMMLSMLADFCCDGSVGIDKKYGRKQYYEFIDRVNLIVKNSSLYDFYLNFKDNLTHAVANERKNGKEIRNMNAFTKICLLNYLFNERLENIKIDGISQADLGRV